MKSKKTAIIFAPYFPPKGGGLEYYAHTISRTLSREYHWRIIVVTSGEKNGRDTVEQTDDFVLHRLAYQYKFSNTPFSFGWLAKIKEIMRSENPDLVNIHMPVPGIGDVAWLATGKRPLVITYHAGSMHKNNLWQDIFIWLYEHGPLQLLLRRADRIICSSDFVRFNLLKRYIYKSITITPGVDADFFKPDPSRKTEQPTLLFVAVLAAERNKKDCGYLSMRSPLYIKNFPMRNL